MCNMIAIASRTQKNKKINKETVLFTSTVSLSLVHMKDFWVMIEYQ